jgi:hypothetical protein
VEHVAYTDIINAYEMSIGDYQWKKPLGRCRRGLEDDIKMDLEVRGCENTDWIHVAQDMVHGGVL